MVQVELPATLRRFAGISEETWVEIPGPPTIDAVLDALDAKYPTLRGTIRDPLTGQRRPYLRYFACQQDVSFESTSDPLPNAIAAGQEPLIVMGAISGG